VTDVPFFRNQGDRRVCQVLRHLAVCDIPPELRDHPHFSWEYSSGSPSEFGEVDRAGFVPGAMGEWTIRTFLHLRTLYEQREVRDVPVVRRKGLYPTTLV